MPPRPPPRRRPHGYTLLHLVMLTEKAKDYDQALRGADSPASDKLRRQLPSNIFIQYLVGPAKLRKSAFGYALGFVAWTTLAVAPVLLLLMMQLQFLPFHSSFITWTQRVALVLDLALIWWLWGTILSWPGVDEHRHAPWEGPAIGLVLSAFVVLFSWTAATFPGEWQEDHWPDGRPFLTTGESGPAKKVSLHDWVFQSPVDPVSRRRWLPLSNTLVLTRLNIYGGLSIDDPEKPKWHALVFHARGRDLRGAIFDLANLQRVDFHGADLRDASLVEAQLQAASLKDAKLQGASLDGAQLQGASLNGAKLQNNRSIVHS